MYTMYASPYLSSAMSEERADLNPRRHTVLERPTRQTNRGGFRFLYESRKKTHFSFFSFFFVTHCWFFSSTYLPVWALEESIAVFGMKRK